MASKNQRRIEKELNSSRDESSTEDTEVASTSDQNDTACQGGRHFAVVTYPGIVKNNAKAIRNLGGVEKISRDFHEQRTLELRTDPENVYERPLFSSRKKAQEESTSVLVVVRAQRRKKSNGEWECEGRVEGVVDTVDEFRGISDFQYLPIKTRNDDGTLKDVPEDLTPKLYPQDIPSALDWLDYGLDDPPAGHEHDEMFLPPFVFSRYVNPSPYLLTREVSHRSDQLKERMERTDVIGMSLRSERKATTISLTHEEEFPIEPSFAAVETANQRVKNMSVHKAFEDLFQERPVWVRNAIQVKTGYSEPLIKWMIGKYAFYISSGPWGRTWCRFGYDPRKDYDAVRYQTIMCQFRNHAAITKRNRLRLSSSDQLLTGRSSTKTTIATEDSSYKYKSGNIPEFRQVFYCIGDIDLPVARKFLTDVLEQNKDAVAGQIADPNHGFLPFEAIDIIRQAIMADVANTNSILEKEQKAKGEESNPDWEIPEAEITEHEVAMSTAGDA